MQQNIYGELPVDSTVFAACDSGYFLKFAPAFVESIRQNTSMKNIHIHVINPTDEVLSLACYMNSRCHNKVTYTFNDADLSEYNSEQTRAIYASLRFLVAPAILPFAKELLILDIDCMLMEDFEYPEKAVGYFPREPLPGTVGWEAEGTKCAAGCVYYHKDAMNVAEAVAQTLEKLPVQWFNDQIALNHVVNQIPEDMVHKFNDQFMDWEFYKGTTIWTGKGPRKYNNSTYIEKQNYYNDAIMNNDYDKVILKPRLDIPFKKFDTVRAGSVNEPIREYWQKFADNYQAEGYFVVESPRWMFNNTIEKLFGNSKEILIPHVEHHNWNGTHKSYYYMQTVFPWLFTVDTMGWAGGASYISSFDENAEYTDDAYYMMKEKLGEGKFGHLQSSDTPWQKIYDKYIVVPLQLPHDETIKYHSNFSVPHFVEQLCKFASTQKDYQFVFKGHPVNFAAMEPLKKIIDNFDDRHARYIANANFNELVAKADAMFVLNGGSGQEAMLHGIPVVCFGQCDYAPAVMQGDIDNIDEVWKQFHEDDHAERIELYKKWYDWYVHKVVIDVNKSLTHRTS